MKKEDIVTTIDLLRHGECEGGEIFRGTTNVVLSEIGWKNMQRVVEYQHKEKTWEHVISSPLLRCKLFAEHISQEHDLSLSIEDDFSEMDFGDWEGKEFHKIWEKEREKAESIYKSPHTFQPPNGEAMSDFSERVIKTGERVLQENKGKHLLLIQHGGTIRILLTHLLSMPMSSMTRFHIPYACFSRIQIHHREDMDATNLVFHNIPC